MTSNQISAAAQREEARHNSVYEQETARHNAETERLSRDTLDYQRQYDAQKMQLEERLTMLQLEMTRSNEERKRDLEAQEMGVRQQMAQLEMNYKQQMAVIETSKANVDKNYREAMAKVSKFNAALEAKRLYYENQKTEATTQSILANVELAKKRYELDKSEITQKYNLGLISASQRDTELNLREKEYQLEQNKWDEALRANVNSQTAANKADATNKSVNTAIRVFDTIKSIFGSMQ